MGSFWKHMISLSSTRKERDRAKALLVVVPQFGHSKRWDTEGFGGYVPPTRLVGFFSRILLPLPTCWIHVNRSEFTSNTLLQSPSWKIDKDATPVYVPQRSS
jgi:hypothetical protein